MARSKPVVLRPAAMAELLESEKGPVMHNMAQRADRVKRLMIQLAPRDTGNLASRILVRPGKEKGKAVFMIGPLGVPYARYVSEGTPPHYIEGVDGPLVFRWPNGPDGDKVYGFWFVFHPGTKPNDYQQRALEAAK